MHTCTRCNDAKNMFITQKQVHVLLKSRDDLSNSMAYDIVHQFLRFDISFNREFWLTCMCWAAYMYTCRLKIQFINYALYMYVSCILSWCCFSPKWGEHVRGIYILSVFVFGREGGGMITQAFTFLVFMFFIYIWVCMYLNSN